MQQPSTENIYRVIWLLNSSDNLYSQHLGTETMFIVEIKDLLNSSVEI